MIDYMFHMTEDLSIFKQEHLALRMERFFESKLYSYPYLLLARLFQHQLLELEEIKIILPSVIGSTEEKPIRENQYQLLSLMSSQQSVKNILMETESDIGIFGIMIKLVQTKFQKGVTKFSKSQIQRALINIVMNLSCDPKEAESLMANPLFKKVVKIGFETLDIGLLKIINNVTHFCPPEMTLKLSETVVAIREILKKQFEDASKNLPVI